LIAATRRGKWPAASLIGSKAEKGTRALPCISHPSLRLRGPPCC
jgi:hypothetical protein